MKTLFITFISIFTVLAPTANFQLYVFNKTTGTYISNDIDSVSFQSKTKRLNFVNLKKSSDGKSLLISDIPQDTYDITIYRLYYPDKTIKDADLNRPFYKSTVEFTDTDKLTPSKPSYPGGKEAFYCFIKKNANSSIIKTENDLFDICFSIDSIGNSKAYLYSDKKLNKVAEEINRVLLNAPKWTPAMLKGKGLNWAFCCANWWTDCKACE